MNDASRFAAIAIGVGAAAGLVLGAVTGNKTMGIGLALLFVIPGSLALTKTLNEPSR